MEEFSNKKFDPIKEQILSSDSFKKVLKCICNICILYKSHDPLTPKVLETEYKKSNDGRSIPFKEAKFNNLIDFLIYIDNYIVFDGTPSYECEIKPIVPENLKHIHALIVKDRQLIKPGYSVNGKKIFFLSMEKQMEIIKFVVKHPKGVDFETIEENFIKKFKLDERFHVKKGKDLITQFMTHTDLFVFNNRVYHSFYFNEELTKHKYMNEDGTLMDVMVEAIKELKFDVPV